MAIQTPPYLVWRDGRPRWVPGPRLRPHFKARDLKDQAGRWLGLEAAIAAARALNDEVAACADRGRSAGAATRLPGTRAMSTQTTSTTTPGRAKPSSKPNAKPNGGRPSTLGRHIVDIVTLRQQLAAAGRDLTVARAELATARRRNTLLETEVGPAAAALHQPRDGLGAAMSHPTIGARALTAAEVGAEFGRSASWVYDNWHRLIDEKRLPRPVGVAGGLMWNAAQVYAVLDKGLTAEQRAAAMAYRAALAAALASRHAGDGSATIADAKAALDARFAGSP